MRSKKAIMTSRREFLSNALGVALVTASTWPIRTQALSMHGQSDSSTFKSKRATQKISLSWDVFLAPSIPAITSDLPPGEKERPWPPISSTLISGEREAVLVDTPITVEQARALANWVAARGKNLTTIYATHGHGDHFFGASAVLDRFPGARFIARPEVIRIMRQQASPESLATFWNPRFPGQISSHLAIAEELAGNVINLEGHDLVSLPLGFTDTANTTCLHVPSIGLIVAGDAAYNGVHLHLSESPDQQKRQEWIAALDKMDLLKPRAVIAGHKRVGTVTKAALRYFREKKAGQFIQFSSVGGRLALRDVGLIRRRSGVSKASPGCFRAKWHRSASRSPSLNPVAFAQTSRAVPPNLAKVILNTIRRLELPQDFSGTTTASSLVTPKRQLRRSSS